MTPQRWLARRPANRQFPGRMVSLAMAGLLRGAIRLYQLTLAYFFVGACRYAPRGYRSSGPIRATLYGGGDAGYLDYPTLG